MTAAGEETLYSLKSRFNSAKRGLSVSVSTVILFHFVNKVSSQLCNHCPTFNPFDSSQSLKSHKETPLTSFRAEISQSKQQSSLTVKLIP